LSLLPSSSLTGPYCAVGVGAEVTAMPPSAVPIAWKKAMHTARVSGGKISLTVR